MSDAQNLILDRLERLPVTRFVLPISIICGLAWMIESFDIGVVGVAMVPIEKSLHLTAVERGIFASAANIGIVIGCASAGALADRYGRKQVLVWSTAWYSVASCASALAGNFPVLVALRIIAGLGMGASFPLPYAIISEFAPRRRRSLLTGLADAFNSSGYFAAPLLGFWLVPALAPDVSWRVLFALCGLGAIYALIINRWVPESPRWLYVKGRTRQALAALAAIEARAGIALSVAADPPAPSDLALGEGARMPRKARSWTDLLHGRLLQITVIAVVAFAATNLLFMMVTVFMPHILVGRGFALAASFAFTALIQSAPIPGKIINGFFGEIFGRKLAVSGFMLLAAVGVAFFGGLSSPLAVAVYGFAMMFFGGGVFASMKTYWSEQYPTELRGSGSGLVESTARLIGSVLGLFMVPLALHRIGVQWTFDAVAVFLVFGALLIIVWGRETRGKLLEAISADHEILVAPASGSARRQA